MWGFSDSTGSPSYTWQPTKTPRGTLGVINSIRRINTISKVNLAKRACIIIEKGTKRGFPIILKIIQQPDIEISAL